MRCWCVLVCSRAVDVTTTIHHPNHEMAALGGGRKGGLGMKKARENARCSSTADSILNPDGSEKDDGIAVAVCADFCFLCDFFCYFP